MHNIYFTRHGETVWNVENKICGMTDSPLTARGQQQARQLGELVRDSGLHIDEILYSPLSRAADTAKAIAAATGLPARCEPRLREQCFGKYEGTPRDGAEFRISKTHFADRYDGGESMMQLAQRIYNLLDELKADIRAKALENAKKQADSAFEQAAVDKAAENTTVDMPKALVENELDIQMERFGYQLQMSGYSMEQYAKMMGGDVSTMRNAFRPAAEKQAKISVTLEKIAEVEGITASDEDIEAEFKSLAEQYELEVDKVKEMVPMDELTGSIKTRKAIKVIVDSAVPVAPKAEEKTEE